MIMINVLLETTLKKNVTRKVFQELFKDDSFTGCVRKG